MSHSPGRCYRDYPAASRVAGGIAGGSKECIAGEKTGIKRACEYSRAGKEGGEGLFFGKGIDVL